MAEIMKFWYDNQENENLAGFGGVIQNLTELSPEESAKAAAGVVEAIHRYSETDDYNILEDLISTTSSVNAGKSIWEALYTGMQEAAATGKDFFSLLMGNPEQFGDKGSILMQLFSGDPEEFMSAIKLLTEETLPDFIGLTDNASEIAHNFGVSMGEARAESHEAGREFEYAGIQADTASGKMKGLSGSASDTARKVWEAARAAFSLGDSLRNIPKTIDVTVNYHEEVSRAANRRISGYTEGIYSATGGMVDWKPRGTDTVPAMLTPGEFIVRKSAVDLFGITTLEKINGMDVGGAFDAMWARAGAMAHNNVVNNNYYDNHAQVVNNFYGTTGQGFSQKIALRALNKI